MFSDISETERQHIMDNIEVEADEMYNSKLALLKQSPVMQLSRRNSN